jgi:predicted phosphodiesterase
VVSAASSARRRIAVIADIHGNTPALEAVLDDLGSQGPDEVLVAGDLVGRGPRGSAVIAEVRARGWRSVRGNHEDYLLAFRRREVPEAWWRLNEWSAARWMAAELSEDDVAYLESLPLTISSDLNPDLVLTHGTPRSHSEGLGPWSSDGKLTGHLERISGSLLVCAHTHRPMHRTLPAGQVVNVGSVGLPFNGDRRAQYAVLDLEKDRWTVRFRQVDYDLDRTLEIYDTSGFRSAGGVTAELLRLELLHAAPFLVPFLKWCEALGAAPAPERIAEFLDLYDPAEPVHEFFVRLDGILGARRDRGS